MFELDRRLVLTAAGGLILAPGLALAQDGGEEFIGPLPSWLDARRDFGAIGDGRADDSAALQQALNALVAAGEGSRALFIPAGRYRITRTLVLPRKAGREARGLTIQGEDPARTMLVWDGARGGRMFEYGAWYSALGRISFEGAGKAEIALAHGSEFVTGSEIADCWFQNAAVAIEAGHPDTAGIAETAVLRCRFTRCDVGISLRNFNSLDWWVWRCRFEDCGTGLTNLYGAGNFQVYECVFLRSREADISIRNTGFLAFRDNLSMGSKAFFVARAVEAGAELTFQRNRIVDTTDVASIRVANLGPVILIDNTFVSRAGQAGPVVQAWSAAGLAIGNRYTAADGAALKGGSTLIDETTRAPRPAIAIPPPEPVPRRFAGEVVVIPPQTPAAVIQARIDALAKSGRPAALYIAPGGHAIDRTLTIPAGADLRLVGESHNGASRLTWTGAGAGPILRLAGPSRARIQQLTLAGELRADGVEIDGQGELVRCEQTSINGSTDAGYDFGPAARVLMSDINHAGNKVGMRLNGAGRTGAPITILSGASSDNFVSYELNEGARLLAKDIWYESGSKPTFMHLTGSAEFVLSGSNIALPRKAGEPSVMFSRFSGKAAFLNVLFTNVGSADTAAISPAGAGGGSNLLVIGQGTGEFFEVGADPGQFARLHGLTYTAGGGAKPLPDRGEAEPGWVRGMLALIRTPPQREAAAVRLHRVYFSQCRTGLRVI